MPDQRVKFVCFDLGGVLVRLVKGWDEAQQLAGVTLRHPTEEHYRRHRELMVRYETGEFGETEYLRRVPECVPGASADEVSRAYDAYLLGLYPGVPQLIADLRLAGLVTGCLSNTNERHWRTMTSTPEYAPLRDLDHPFASHQLRVMKPAEEAFRHVERATGLGGEEILFFDDKPENVHAARKVGWRAETVEPAENPVPQMRAILRRHAALS